ncbi:efflux RND transporter periplasmic adaptor subunit [Thalassotalea sp. LPB0316]|uniref:efflux RND transporter periplasmic adaptor subunit n=1 Tax=Thalassotalea sp. LPB0316 TaxID=2769490 RepID=UPI001865B20D|nr:efflux RND transporter periplasmic adaptor subunit [Thalassotalea sp. LPB0316]QOL24952.1 efflux RND transporter periplasmic adaptor subunit [Thalassotalea sp. LPB0316]
MKNLANVPFIKPIIAFVFLAVSIAWLAGFFNDKMAPSSKAPHSLSGGEKWTVSSMPIVRQETISATISPMEDTVISARIMARISTIHVRAGQRVERGQLLVTLEQSELIARVKQLEQQKNAVSARLSEANKLLARAQQLHQQNLLSTQELDKSQANFDALKAEEMAAQEGLNQAKTNLSFAKLTAPIDGVVIERLAEPGNTAQPGTPLLTIYNPSTLQVEAYVREQLAIGLTIDEALQIVIPSLELTTTATIAEIVPSANIGARSFLIKANINTAIELKPGMYATVLLNTEEENVIKVPMSYVSKLGQLDIVLVKKDGVVSRRFVKLGHVDEQDQVEVISGINDQEVIVKPLKS